MTEDRYRREMILNVADGAGILELCYPNPQNPDEWACSRWASAEKTLLYSGGHRIVFISARELGALAHA